ncbi:MAG: response regulator [Desulfobacterales bacterium]|nr:response regulator [Desulfobacterales bacterium]
MKLTARLSLLFMLLSVLSIAVVGYLAYYSGQETITRETIQHLISTNQHKKAELDRWIQDNARVLEMVAATYFFKHAFPEVMAAHDVRAPEHLSQHAHMVEIYLKPFLHGTGFFELFIMRTADGKVLLSTDASQEEKFYETQPFFIKGQAGTHIQNLYYSMTLRRPAITMSTPLRDARGNTMAVLAGQADLAALSSIFGAHGGMRPSQDSYLVNTFNFFITEPRFGKGYALRKSIFTEGVQAALAKHDGIGLYNGYRGMPVIGAYLWLDEWDLALITEIDQEEAFAPIRDLGRKIFYLGTVIALLAALAGWGLAHTITRPLHRLAQAAERIGQGDLEHSAAVAGTDEIGHLAAAFDQMKEKLKETLVSRDLLTQQVAVRLQAVAALRESEAFTRDVLNSLPSHIAVLDETGAIMAVNEAWERFAAENGGARPGIGDNYLAVCEKAAQGQSLAAAQAREALAGILAVSQGDHPYFTMEYPCDAPDQKRWFVLRATPLLGRRRGVVCAHIDITQRKLAEEGVLHLNRVLRSIRDINQLIVHEKEPQGLIEQACDLLVRHRSYDSALIVLTDAQNRPTAHAQAGLGTAMALLDEALRQGQLPACCRQAPQEGGIFHVPRHDKLCAACGLAEKCRASDTLCIRLVQAGTCYGYIAVALDPALAQDPDERALFLEMAGDLAFALHTITLGQEIRQTTRERDQFEAQLRQAQKMEAVGRLAGGVAHDFNNMLSIITGYGELARNRVSPNDPLHDDLNEILKAAECSADLTRQLLAFARRQTIAPRVLDLNITVTHHEKMLKRLVGEDIELRFVPEANLWPILMDESQIDQILANFAVNSRDAIAGVGRIAIETRNVILGEAECIRHLDCAPGDYVALFFGDSGKGMDPQTQEHLFEPFFTTKEKDKGTGLGLSTVYGIVKQNRGLIQVETAPGEGTTFRVYFPRHHGEAVAPIEEIETPQSGNETILLVEDEREILKLFEIILQRLGYRVLSASLPGEALVLCEKNPGPIDLLITDVIMPTMNGNELRTRIEHLKPGIKTLFMSGYTADIIARRGMVDEGIGFIQKPFSPQALARKVRRVLDGG